MAKGREYDYDKNLPWFSVKQNNRWILKSVNGPFYQKLIIENVLRRNFKDNIG